MSGTTGITNIQCTTIIIYKMTIELILSEELC